MAVSSASAAEKSEAGGGLDVSFTHGFIASLSVIIVSELGDKTFFIAAILSMQHSRLTVFLGAVGALFTMTVLSGEIGREDGPLGRDAMESADMRTLSSLE